MPKKSIPVEHALGEAWRKHVAEVLLQLNAAEGRVTVAKAQILDTTREIEFMRKHLGVLVHQLAEAEHLPQPVEPYRLSEDGTKIVGRTSQE